MSNKPSLRIMIVGSNLTLAKLESLHNAVVDSALIDGVVEADAVTVESHVDIAQVTDGYHSFDELYRHRHALFIALCCELRISGNNVWYSHTHHDGSGYPGWVLVGAELPNGLDVNDYVVPISYHLPESYIPHLEAAGVVFVPHAPKWDGHTSHDVIDRLLAAYGDSATRITHVDEDAQYNAAEVIRKEKGISSNIFGDTIYNKETPDTSIIAISGSDDRVPERDMLGHVYSIGRGEHSQGLQFQQGPVPQYGANGATNEAILAILLHRTEHLNSQFPCEENEVALEHMRAALRSFESRTAKRIARGVEGVEVK